MKARNKHTGRECEVFWNMCDIGRKCEASDRPITPDMPIRVYNAVVDDYMFCVNGKWIEGLDFIKDPYSYDKCLTLKKQKSMKSEGVGLPLCSALFLAFVVLKLSGVINWSWWWVTCPLWGPFVFVLVLYLLLYLLKHGR